MPTLKLAHSSSLGRFTSRWRAPLARLAVTAGLLGTILFGASTAAADEGPSRAQVIQTFFEGMSSQIAEWAHPTVRADVTRVQVDENGVHVAVRYKSTDADEQPVITVLFIPIDNLGRFGRFQVEANRNTIFPPFFAATLIKAIATHIVETEPNNDDSERSAVLRAIQQKMREEWNRLDGNELCKYVLQYKFAESGAWSSFLSS